MDRNAISRKHYVAREGLAAAAAAAHLTAWAFMRWPSFFIHAGPLGMNGIPAKIEISHSQLERTGAREGHIFSFTVS